MGVAEQYAQKTMAAAMGHLTPEQARQVWLSVSLLVQFARDAEQAAFLAMSESMGNGNPVTLADFEKFTREHLGRVRDQLVFVGRVINGSKEG